MWRNKYDCFLFDVYVDVIAIAISAGIYLFVDVDCMSVLAIRYDTMGTEHVLGARVKRHK